MQRAVPVAALVSLLFTKYEQPSIPWQNHSVAKPLDCTDDWELLAERLTRRVMSRRQTLFRAAVLALVRLLSFDCLLIAQLGKTTVGSVRLSDRERLGLRGPVKKCSDFFGDDQSRCATWSTLPMDGCWFGGTTS
jgi:hypothetical protein